MRPTSVRAATESCTSEGARWRGRRARRAISGRPNDGVPAGARVDRNYPGLQSVASATLRTFAVCGTGVALLAAADISALTSEARMGILAWIILGLIAGAIAKAIMPGRDPGGFVVTALIGIVGAVIGGFLGNMLFGIGGVSGIDIRSILIAVCGALVLLWIYRLATGRRAV